MEHNVIYTAEAKKRKEILSLAYLARIEDIVVRAKRLPGDQVVEITASDLDRGARELGRKENRRTGQRSLMLRVWGGVGFFLLLAGIFFPQMEKLFFGSPFRFSAMVAGSSLLFAVWVFFAYKKAAHSPDDERSAAEAFGEQSKRLGAELAGRFAALAGHLLGESAIDQRTFKAVDQDRLEEATSQCWEGYRKLIGYGAAEYLALNNLIFYASVTRSERFREFVLENRSRLNEIGEDRSSINLRLTYCRAVIEYGGSDDELKSVRSILVDIKTSEGLGIRARKEADVYLDLIKSRENRSAQPVEATVEQQVAGGSE